MKNTNRLSVILVLSALLVAPAFSQELSKEDWQKQVTELTTKRNDLKNKLATLQSEIASLQKQDGDKAAALKQCEDALAALVGQSEAPLIALLDKIDMRLNELSRLSN
ncbi:MAG: hypothetical protein HYY49_13825, partial [Ignavibacteriales bacterium]|nr:hypothetical protein [Ignavibacteriales bacterium]